MKRWWINVLACVFLSAFSLRAVSGQKLAPDFTLPGIQGKSISLQDYRGRYVLLHFWATWCVPCIKEMPEIEQAYRSLKAEGLTVLAVNAGESKKKVGQYITKRNFTFPVLLDRDWEVAEQYRVIGLPVSIFIGPSGWIHNRVQGGSLTKPRIAQWLKKMTSESSP